MTRIKALKLIKNFQRNHKRVFDEGNTDCVLVENEIWRVASKRKDWLGDDESYDEAIKEQEEKDKSIRCYVCEFINKLKEELK